MPALVLAALVMVCSLAEARPDKPKVPPGRDPGGIAIALIGGGIDYRRSDIAARLARDGEGEIVGWDFADDDARPFSASDENAGNAALLLAEGQTARLVPVRVTTGRHGQIAAALRFVGGTPARVALILADPGTPLPIAGLAEAARQLSGLLVLVPAHHVAGGAGSSGLSEADRAGLLVVAADSNATLADVAVAPTPGAAGLTGDATDTSNRDDRAAIRVAALAVRVIRTEPQLSGLALRMRIVSFARPQMLGPPAIPDIARLRWRD
jgi:hypothetical protein